MAVNITAYQSLITELSAKKVLLVAVSKTKPIEDIRVLYDLGQRDFGENYVQELLDKEAVLPKDIHWHFIGHLQSNKVKSIITFVHLIHGIDSFKLLKEVNKQAAKNNRVVNCLLQVHIAREETKFGFDEQELLALQLSELRELKNVSVTGLMGMASFTGDTEKVKQEFKILKSLFDRFSSAYYPLTVLSMGMSGDYKIALTEGSTLVRVGSLLFGAREYAHNS
jgi:pyridoxal phosphate enzyme (YggS family)